MPKLTKTRLAEVRSALDESLFTSAGFLIETGTPKDNLIASISLLDNPKCYLRLQYEQKRLANFALMEMSRTLQGEGPSMVMMVYQSPGDFVENESLQVKDFSAFLACVRTWTQLLKTEILLVDIFEKRLNEFQEKLNKQLDEHCSDPKAHFTDEEREKLMESLRAFQERFTKLEEADENLRSEVADMKQALSDLARASVTLSKRSWFRTACSKLYEISARAMSSKPGQKLLEGAIDKLLELPKGDG